MTVSGPWNSNPANSAPPRTLPVFDPAPPILSAMQMKNVWRGRKVVVVGLVNPFDPSQRIPPSPISAQPITNTLSLNTRVSLPSDSATCSSSRIALSTRPNGELPIRVTT